MRTTLTMILCGLSVAATADDTRAPTEPEKTVIEAGIRRELRDPDSAQFRDMKVGADDGQSYVCGEVNSKNAYGGYVGFSKFMAMLIVRDGKPAAAILIGIDNERQTAVRQMCANMGM